MHPTEEQFTWDKYAKKPIGPQGTGDLAKMGKALNVANTVKGSNVNPQKSSYAKPSGAPYDWAKD